MVNYKDILSHVPKEWAKQIADILCKFSSSTTTQDNCNLQRECETLTSLSDYVQNGSIVTITFVGEDGISYKRSLDMNLLIRYLFDDIDSSCMGVSKTDWLNMSFTERIEAIIADVNQCCIDATSTTTSTSSTTTTTTEASTTTTTTEASTTTTTTDTTTTTSTTTSSSTTTTTTQAFTVDITNDLSGTTITEVNNIVGFNLFDPVSVAERAQGFHDAFTDSIQVVIDGPPIFNGNLTLSINGISFQCVNLLTGDSYPKTVNFSSNIYGSGFVITISANIGLC